MDVSFALPSHSEGRPPFPSAPPAVSQLFSCFLYLTAGPSRGGAHCASFPTVSLVASPWQALRHSVRE